MVYLYLVCGIIIGCLFTWIFLQRKGAQSDVAMSSDERMALKDNASKLITEFNKVSNTNINILEDKIRDVREAVELADKIIIRINSSLSDMGIVARRIQETDMPLREIPKHKGIKEHETVDTEAQRVQLTERIFSENKENMPLTEDKFMSTVDISLPAALPLSRVMLTEDEPVLQHEIPKKTLVLLKEVGRNKKQEVKSTKKKIAETKAQRVQRSERASLPEVLSPPEVLPPTERLSLPEVLPPISKSQTLVPVSLKKKGKKEKEEKKHEKPVLTPLPRTATKEEKREVINELISAGFAVEDISKAVGLSQTEVQLILGLKKKR